MKSLLRIAHLIDALNERVGRAVYWLILVTVIISSGNALMRKFFSISSNAFLEIQWTLFAAVFLLAAGYTLKHNDHVRIDVIAGRFGKRTQAWLDIIGGTLFLLPMTGVILYFSWPFFMHSFNSGEWSGNPGGLLLWPSKALIPAGFALLLLQGVAEIIKRLGFLYGDEPPEAPSHPPCADMIINTREGDA